MNVEIDINFDFRTDANGKDPDSHSPTLKRYHKHLWTKPLPSGELFFLEDAEPKNYLVFSGSSGQHFLTSDSIANSYSMRKGKISLVISSLEPSTAENFRRINSTIGANILFPGKRVGGKATINGARGFHYYIQDRFDLTLECIRRHYLSVENPLDTTLQIYKPFFDLFENFKNYVDFFLLNDLVSLDYSEVKLFLPVERLFDESPLPRDTGSYKKYYENSINFTQARNKRISSWVNLNRTKQD